MEGGALFCSGGNLRCLGGLFYAEDPGGGR